MGLRTSSVFSFLIGVCCTQKVNHVNFWSILDLGQKFQPVCLHVYQELIFTLPRSVPELVAVDSLYNEHREMNASESTICGILSHVTKVSLMDDFFEELCKREVNDAC